MGAKDGYRGPEMSVKVFEWVWRASDGCGGLWVGLEGVR